MGTHKKILGVVFIVWGILCTLGFIFASVIVSSVLPVFIEHEEFRVISQFVPYVLGFILLPIAALSILGGIGVLNRKEWAMTLVLVVGILLLLCYPIGTILGIYAILVYYDDHRKKSSITNSESSATPTN